MDFYLPLNASDEDPLGFNDVSGFYGPGAWSAWFLVVCTSYFRLFKPAGSTPDPSTWIFVLTVNGAALDMILHIRKLGNLMDLDNAEYTKEAACIGAALEVIYWGLFHQIMHAIVELRQLGFPKEMPPIDIYSVRQHFLRDVQKLSLLVFGMLLPFVSLTIFGAYYLFWPGKNGGGALKNIPAFYWPGMGADTHDAILGVASLTGPPFLTLILLGVGIVCWKMLSSNSTLKETLSKIWRILCGIWLLALSVAIFIILPIAIRTGHGNYWMGFVTAMSPLILYIAIGLTVCLQEVLVGFGSSAYIIDVYLVRRVPSKSCFFMPCAPQAILDMDQAAGLILGLFLVVFFEFKQWRCTRKIFRVVIQRVFAVGFP